MIARRLRIAFLNVQATQEALPGIIDIMAEELHWSQEEKMKQFQQASEFLAYEMGQIVNRVSRDKIPINLTKDEVQLYIKRFGILDKDKKGYVSINDIRRGLKVCTNFDLSLISFSYLFIFFIFILFFFNHIIDIC
jgi:glycerol-3-phosphate dehydrogenase